MTESGADRPSSPLGDTLERMGLRPVADEPPARHLAPAGHVAEERHRPEEELPREQPHRPEEELPREQPHRLEEDLPSAPPPPPREAAPASRTAAAPGSAAASAHVTAAAATAAGPGASTAPPAPADEAAEVTAAEVTGQAHRTGHRAARGRHASDALTAEQVLRPRREPPPGGWRRAVFRATGGAVDPGRSAAQQTVDDLVARATRPVPGCWRIAVLSLKGGVGKTTTTAALGVQLATLRGDRVVAVDANPDRGTLAEKVPDPSDKTVRDLLRDRSSLRRYSDVRAYTSLSPSRLEVLASASDPTVSQAFSEQDYRAAVSVLEHYYSLVLTDCGTGLLHSAMSGVLGLADALVVVTSANLDGARSASATLDWLQAHGHSRLVATSVAVVSAVRPRGGLVDVDAVDAHFAGRCRAVVRVPFDPHLEAGAVVDLDALRPATRRAYLELAAAIGDGLP